MQRKYIIAFILIILIIGLGVFYYKTQNIPISPPELDEIKETSTEPSLEELKAKTANWEVYEDEEYGIKVKYPFGWSYYDKSSFPYGIIANWEEYDAVEIFRTVKTFTEHEGVGISIFYSRNLSRIPTKESIAKDYNKRSISADIDYFLVDNFEGVVVVTENDKGRWQRALAYLICDKSVYYIDWVLDDNFNDIDVRYQNQFLPFLASFEIKDQKCLKK